MSFTVCRWGYGDALRDIWVGCCKNIWNLDQGTETEEQPKNGT